MKTKNLLPLLFIMFLINITGCKKSTPTARTPQEILTGNSWQPGELRAQESNTTYYYKRGGSNAWNLDLEYILFKTDLTGTYGDADGITTTPITWNFTNTDQTSLSFTIQYSIPITIYWSGIIYADSKVIYTQYLTRSNGSNSLASGYRIPK